MTPAAHIGQEDQEADGSMHSIENSIHDDHLSDLDFQEQIHDHFEASGSDSESEANPTFEARTQNESEKTSEREREREAFIPRRKPGVGEFPCPNCKKCFARERYMKEHRAKVHPESYKSDQEEKRRRIDKQK